MGKCRGKWEGESLNEDLMWFNRNTRISCSTEQWADCHLQQPITYLKKNYRKEFKVSRPKEMVREG